MGRNPCDGEGAEQLVQGIVSTDILAAEAQRAGGVNKQSSMQRAGVAGTLLELTDALAQPNKMLGWGKWAR